jgi:hypothetical protein
MQPRANDENGRSRLTFATVLFAVVFSVGMFYLGRGLINANNYAFGPELAFGSDTLDSGPNRLADSIHRQRILSPAVMVGIEWAVRGLLPGLSPEQAKRSADWIFHVSVFVAAFLLFFVYLTEQGFSREAAFLAAVLLILSIVIGWETPVATDPYLHTPAPGIHCPADAGSVLFFVLLAWAATRKKLTAWFVILPLAVLNRETALLMIPAFWLTRAPFRAELRTLWKAFRQDAKSWKPAQAAAKLPALAGESIRPLLSREVFVPAVISLLIFAAIKATLISIIAAKGESPAFLWMWPKTWFYLRLHWPEQVFNMTLLWGGSLLLAPLGFARLSWPIKAQFIMLPFVVAMALTVCVVFELRIYAEYAVFVIPAAVAALFPPTAA